MPLEKVLEAEEEISDDLLDNIPSIDAEAPSEVHAIVEGLRREVESAFRAELDRVESVFARHLGDLQERLRAADGRLASLAAERQRLLETNMAHERRWEAVRALAGRLD